MPKFDNPLNHVSVASPCSADWSEMYGDNRKRFCGDCKLNVYNLSGMSRDEAEALIMNAEGRLCVRFYRRADGTVLTRDCPVGWAKVKQQTRVFAAAVGSLLIALFTGVLFASLFSKPRLTVGSLLVPFATPTPQRLMGVMALPGPTPTPAADEGWLEGEIATPKRLRKIGETNGLVRITRSDT